MNGKKTVGISLGRPNPAIGKSNNLDSSRPHASEKATKKHRAAMDLNQDKMTEDNKTDTSSNHKKNPSKILTKLSFGGTFLKKTPNESYQEKPVIDESRNLRREKSKQIISEFDRQSERPTSTIGEGISLPLISLDSELARYANALEEEIRSSTIPTDNVRIGQHLGNESETPGKIKK